MQSRGCWYFLLFFCFLYGKVESEESQYDFSGRHFIASYTDCDQSAIADIGSLREAFLRAVSKSGATVLDSIDYVFHSEREPSEDQCLSGFTMVVLLSESHASLHTYPEHRACFVDLFTCGTRCSADPFDVALRAYLKPKNVSHKMLERSEFIEEDL